MLYNNKYNLSHSTQHTAIAAKYSFQYVFFFVTANLLIYLFKIQEAAAHFNSPNNTKQCRLLVADRLFDGFELHTDAVVLIGANNVVQVGSLNPLNHQRRHMQNLSDSTILFGFIESDVHTTFQQTPIENVLRHGIATIRDVVVDRFESDN
ncbi:hypothetical protein [Nitrosomonas marina]|uniref:Uncharacterized protein n=1 Tax=Nitrosomonas marina TaxID=917 RepID=A0A1H8FZH5_9PROT|nr:hypothetical protein [Nitrosomonas marina]SEN37241.1 hypothetical protein SAMN05216325_11570 [Nitrosomonas marina]